MKNTYPIVGMSPGNSYFKDKEINYLIQKVIDRFGRVAILIADIPAISTYEALGYPCNKARSKAVLKGNNLKNRTRRIQKELGISLNKIRIIDWENEIDDDVKYKESYKQITELYKENKDFRHEVERTTLDVLEGSGKNISDMDKAVETGIHYLLSELAFLEVAANFLDSKSVTYIYHKNWPIYEKYISGVFDGNKKPHLEFLLLKNPCKAPIGVVQ